MKEPIIEQIQVLFKHYKMAALLIAFGGFTVGAILASLI